MKLLKNGKYIIYVESRDLFMTRTSGGRPADRIGHLLAKSLFKVAAIYH